MKPIIKLLSKFKTSEKETLVYCHDTQYKFKRQLDILQLLRCDGRFLALLPWD